MPRGACYGAFLFLCTADAAAAYDLEPRPEESLYDTWSDPHEVRDLADDPVSHSILEKLRERLDTYMQQPPTPS
jgi:hypothetical protein